MKKRKWLTENEALIFGFEFPPIEKRGRTLTHRFMLNDEQLEELRNLRNSKTKITEAKTETKTNEYKKEFQISAWNEKGYIMDIDEYCQYYKLPRKDVTSYKLVTHTAVPYYNIAYRENVEVKDFDFDKIISKYTKNIKPLIYTPLVLTNPTRDFDVATYSDVHIGMNPDKFNTSTYPTEWHKKEILDSARLIVKEILENKKSNTLVIDDLGDLMDGLGGQTTRGGHSLPQNMTDDEAFDCAIEFKDIILDGVAPNFEKVIINNIVNDNHGGLFGYLVNKMFKATAMIRYNNVEITNHRKFLNHYGVGKIGFVISHGKEEKNTKHGFKVKPDQKDLKRIDDYCKFNKLYQKFDVIYFKKGDSHQCVLDMSSSPDFFYHNYPALSPSSEWVLDNFGLGYKGFVLESFKGTRNLIDPIFTK